MRRLITCWAVAAACALVLAACDVDVDVVVDIDIASDGSGTVAVEAVFDSDATEALSSLEDLLLADLVAADWVVDGPRMTAPGTMFVRAEKAVPSADRLQQVLDEIVGPGVFTAVEVEPWSGFAERRQRVGFDIDLTPGWSLLSDAGVAEALGGEPFGVPVDELTGGRTIDEIIDVEVELWVQADDDHAAAATFAPRFDSDQPTRVQVQAHVERFSAVLLRWVYTALAVLFLLAVALAAIGVWAQRRKERLGPAPTPASLTSRIPGAPAPSKVDPSRNPGRHSRPRPERDIEIRLVVVEPLVVLYGGGADDERHLLEFVRSRGSNVPGDEIFEGHGELIRGRLSTTEFWARAGVGGEPEELDRRWAETRQLRADAPGFLVELERRSVAVAALSDDAASWSHLARDRDRLGAVWPWLVSAELGTTKPDTGAFERLRRETGVAYGHSLFLDTDLGALDAARELGLRTGLLLVEGVELPPIVNHPTGSRPSELLP